VKLVEAYGIKAWRATTRAESRDAIAEARAHDGPAFIEFQIAEEGEDANVYPMVPSGAALDDMIRRPHQVTETE
jgi:acetolactate synthase-1/2/3 large subunit